MKAILLADNDPDIVQFRAELLARNVETLYANPKDRQQFRQNLERDGAIGNFEIQLRRSDGTVMDVVLNSTVQRADGGSHQPGQSQH